MNFEKQQSVGGFAIYFDGNESNEEEGNLVTELNFHSMISFVDYEQLVLGMDAIYDKNSSLVAELVAAKKQIAELEKMLSGR